MEFRNLGNTELKLSLIGVGCNRIAADKSRSNAREIEMTLCEAIDRGINLFDTADVYGTGDSERLLGRILRGHRSKIHICTKAGLQTGVARRLMVKFTPRAVKRILRLKGPSWRRSKSGDRPALKKNFEPGYIEKAVYGSLRRLKTDYLDLFLLHSPPRETVFESGLFEKLARLKHKGIIRYYGVSISDQSKTKDAISFLKVEGVSVLQIMTNPERTMDIGKIVSFSAEKGVGIITREPFSRGNIFCNNRLQEVAADSGTYSLAQMAIRASVQLDEVSSVILGMRSRSHLDENLSALSMPPLSSTELEALYSFTKVY